VLGRAILIDFIPRQVIGVMPRDFRFVNLSPDIFLPQRFPKSGLRPDEFSYAGIARLKPGVRIALANQDVARVCRTLGETAWVDKMIEMPKLKPNLRPLKNDVVGDVGPVLTVLMGALSLVLLLVCANVANLVLVRAQSRRQEFAIRAALGAGWGRIASELLVESLVLGVLGGGLGLLLVYIGLQVLVTHGPATLPRFLEISIDATALAFALACSLGSSLLLGLTPASKLATARALHTDTLTSSLSTYLGLEDASEDELYRAMDWLLERQPRIETSLANRHLVEGGLVLYDLTSTYFEGRHCSLARLGHSRDDKSGKPQIVFGLLTNAAGCPVAVEVWEGNTADPKTIPEQVKKLRERFGLKRLVLVGDQGMITSARIREDFSDDPAFKSSHRFSSRLAAAPNSSGVPVRYQ
jgi:FtsX-like permease family protein